MPDPLVSVVMPAYNAERYIREAIASVQAQTYGNWELVVVDDASSDQTPAILKELAAADNRIRVLRNDVNSGRPARARNAALKSVRGAYVAFLDSDDLWLPEKLERQVTAMRTRNLPFSFHQYRRFADSVDVPGRLIDVPDAVTYRDLLKQNVIGCLTAMVDIRQTGSLSTWDGPRDDMVLWLRILAKGFTATGLHEDLARYRVSPDSVSANKVRMAGKMWGVYREGAGLSRPAAAYYFAHYAWRSVVKHARF